MNCHKKEVILIKLGLIEVVLRGERDQSYEFDFSSKSWKVVEEGLHNASSTCNRNVER